MRAVNLLPYEFRNAKSIKHEDPAVVAGSSVAVIVLIALSSAFVVAHGHANAQQARLTKARLALAQFSAQKRPVPKNHPVQIIPIVAPPTVTGEEATWLSAVSTNLSQRIAWDRILREVSQVIPSDVTLSKLSLAAPTLATAQSAATPGSAASQEFVISGSAFSYDSVARLLSRLALVPDLSDVQLQDTTAGSVTGSASSVVQFDIVAGVKDPAVEAAAADAAAAAIAAAQAAEQAQSTTTGSNG